MEIDRNFLINILIIVFIVALGLIIFNQFLEYKYKAELLTAPCELCAKLNPNQSVCVENCFISKVIISEFDQQFIINISESFG